MAITDLGRKDLGVYLRLRLEHLYACFADFEDHIDEKKLDLCSRVDKGEFSRNDPQVGQIVHHLQCVLANTFRYTLLGGVCSFLEEAMKEVSKRLVADYSRCLKATADGNWLKRHIQVLREQASLNTVPLEADLAKFHDLICLRNCIVHSWGKVAEARNPKAVEDAAGRIETASISKDGYLFFGDQVIPEGILSAENIADEILMAKLGTSMT